MSDTLSVKDNRTGKEYTLPITDGNLRAMDLRQIKVKPDEFGMMSYDPAYMNTACGQSKVSFRTASAASSVTAVTRSRSLPKTAPFSKSPTCSSTASCPEEPKWRTGWRR